MGSREREGGASRYGMVEGRAAWDEKGKGRGIDVVWLMRVLK